VRVRYVVPYAARAMAYDLILIGSGFASSFFLREYLSHADAGVRVLVLERGLDRPHRWQVDNLGALHKAAADTVVNRTPEKPWVFNVAFGGGSNCWWACTPRMLPADFELESRYGVGVDWPLKYEDLEGFYTTAERWMHVAGPSERTPFERSEPYPQKPHRWSTPDESLAAAFDQFYVQPTARARVGTGRRPGCCANATCTTCPIDAKFRVPTDFADLWKDSRIELKLGATVERLEFEGDKVSKVVWTGDSAGTAEGAHFALGANAIFNAHILARSGHTHTELGRGLVEQASISVTVDLDDMVGFDGSTSITGHGYMLYDGPHRRDRAAALIETINVPQLRTEPGLWRNRMTMKFIYGDLRQAKNAVIYDASKPDRPVVEWKGHSDYTERSLAKIEDDLKVVLAPLPVERHTVLRNTTEAHIMGTVPMGADPETSVVDSDLIDHRYRNLHVLGASAFPTAPPANPTLTLSALSIRSAQRFFTEKAP
jgi:choline dehydrogenase-like flavoprotein